MTSIAPGKLIENFAAYKGRRARVIFKPKPRPSTTVGPPQMYTPAPVEGVLAGVSLGGFLLDETLYLEDDVATIELL